MDTNEPQELKSSASSNRIAQGHKFALIYCRVSTAKQQAQGNSLESQARACVALAESLGYKVGEIIKEIFSGSVLWQRPLLSQARRDITTNKYQALIVYALDRLTRDNAHLTIIADAIEHAGARLISVVEDSVGATEGRARLRVAGRLAEAEMLKTRERCVLGKRERAMSGLVHNAGTELYGYRRDKARGAREICEAEARVVRQVYEWFASGVSIRQMITRLNGEGIPSPSVGKRAFKGGRKTFWGKGSITRLLTDPNYKGEAWTWRFQSATRRGQTVSRPQDEWIRLPDETTPAIVSPELWQEAQERLKSNQESWVKQDSRTDLLRGFIFCAVCGQRLVGVNERRSYRVYRCRSRATPLGPCGGRRVPAEVCESSIWKEVQAVLNDGSRFTSLIEQLNKEKQETRAHLQADLSCAQRERQLLEEERSALARLMGNGLRGRLAPLIQAERSSVERDAECFERLVREIEPMGASLDRQLEDLAALSASCIQKASAAFSFAEKRLILSVLGARVIGSGRDWRLETNLKAVERWHALSCIPGQVSTGDV